MRVTLELAVAGALLVATPACGSRSSLLEPGSKDAGVGGAPPSPCAPPSIDAECAAAVLGAPAGSALWTTSLQTGGNDLLGPVAADLSGGTYYLAAEQALYVRAVFALDACGALRWEADVSESIAASGYVPQVMVSGGHLLLVGIGSIVALDVASGKVDWIADLDAFAKAGGLGVPPGKVQAVGFTAARADGAAFSVVANNLDAWIVKVTADGLPSPVAKVSSYLGGMGYPLGSQQLVIDAAGDVVLAGGSNPGSGDRIEAFTPSGKIAFATTLPSWGNSRYLAAGPDYVTGEALWILGLDGTLRNGFVGGGSTFISWAGPTAIDEDGGLFAVGGQHLTPGSSTVTFNLLGGFAASGTQKWSSTLAEPVVGGPVLDDGGHMLVITSASPEAGTIAHLAAFDRADGKLAWQRDLPPSGQIPSYWLLQNTAGALVTVIDDRVHAFASGGSRPPTCAYWPTPRGGLEQRVAPFGK